MDAEKATCFHKVDGEREVQLLSNEHHLL